MTLQGDKSPIQKRIIAYQQSGEGYDSIVSELSWRAYQYPKKKYGFDEDDCAGFFLYVLKRIQNIPDSFKDTGMPFENYFRSTLKLKLKSYRIKKYNCADTIERVSTKEFDENEHAFALEIPEHDRSAESHNPWIIHVNKKGIENEASDKKILLFLALKYVQYLDPAHLEKLAGLTGFGTEWLRAVIDSAKEKIERKMKRLTLLRERRNTLYRRIEILRFRLFKSHDPDWMHEYKIRLDILTERFEKVAHLLKRLSTTVSNKDIALATGFPKGTVDTSMRRLKKRLAERDAKRIQSPDDLHSFMRKIADSMACGKERESA
jgi:hypothetical protein